MQTRAAKFSNNVTSRFRYAHAHVEEKGAGLKMCKALMLACYRICVTQSQDFTRPRTFIDRKMKYGWLAWFCCLLFLGRVVGKTQDEWKSRIIYQVRTTSYCTEVQLLGIVWERQISKPIPIFVEQKNPH